MTIQDNIYGKVEVKEPALLELLTTPSMLRLKRISQFGIPDKYYHFKNFDRYEHSVGVMLLLRKLGADLEEQVAGLLHDVSVLAFSHITDWVFGQGREGKEDYHDSIHDTFIKNTEIPTILAKYNFDLERISNLDNFSLLEKSSPDLCADRVDYALREFKYWFNPKIVNNCVSGLTNFKDEIVFNNTQSAYDFANGFLQLQMQHWGGFGAVMRYHLFSKALKTALDKGYISEPDFYKDEDFISGKIKNTENKEIDTVLTDLEAGNLEKYKNNSGGKVFKKFRYVDPKVIQDSKLIRLSELKPEFLTLLNENREINQKGVII